ncbi:hypothetical protein HYW20_01740 [Candidatus Woesearchaeota archaeon]|nr:hypothetical protein [Candidatus Woesearchaeota archaeon]
MKFKISSIKYLTNIIITFLLFISILYYSYIFKLGYLKIATYLLFFLIALLALINAAKAKNSKVFWLVLFIIFLFALLDKYFKMHIKLSRYFVGIANIDPVVLVNILYITGFIIVMSFFYRFFLREYKRNPDWLYLFTFAVILKIVAISTDFEYHNITEDYFEVFSLYFFAAAFFIPVITRRKNK